MRRSWTNGSNQGNLLCLGIGRDNQLNLEEYYEQYGSRITQESERLFIEDFLYPLLGVKIKHIIPQYPIIDRTGRSRRIDFAYHGQKAKLALEVNGETYHAEGIIPNEMFNDNLFRQNEILRLGYHLVRFSYSQLQAPNWRPIVFDTLRDTFADYAPELLSEYELEPNPIQQEALHALSFFREKRKWDRGVLVMPTGTGKTILSALDARRLGGPVLFLVHRLDILKQSIDAYKRVWPDLSLGILTGEQKENEDACDVLFASKDTLRQPDQLSRFPEKHFRYIVVDEVCSVFDVCLPGVFLLRLRDYSPARYGVKGLRGFATTIPSGLAPLTPSLGPGILEVSEGGRTDPGGRGGV